MLGKIISTLELNGIGKFLCAHGSWLTMALAAHLTGNPSFLATNVSSVIQCLLKRHSTMRTRLRVDDHRYLIDFFEYDSEHLSSDLFISTVETSSDSWQEIVEKRCNQDPYTHNGTSIFPLFHFMLLFDSQQSAERIFHLILFANHCVSDGRSGYVLLNDFLTLATDSNLCQAYEPCNNEILPFIGELIPRANGLFYPLLSFIVKRLIKRQLRQEAQTRIAVKTIPHLDCGPSSFGVQRYKTKFLFASSSSDLYSNLYRQCRSQEVTLNGPLFGCLLLAVHHCFPLDNETRLKPFEIGVAFNMRSRLPRSALTSSSVGYYVSGSGVKLDQSLPIQSTPFWSMARQCMTNTRKQARLSSVSFTMGILDDLFQRQRDFDRLTRFFPEGRQAELAFSNVGKYPYSCEFNKGEIRLRGLHIINNASLYRVSTTIFVTCAGDGQLDFSMAHEMESEDKAKEFLDYFVRLVETCANEKYCKTETTLGQLLKSVQLH